MIQRAIVSDGIAQLFSKWAVHMYKYREQKEFYYGGDQNGSFHSEVYRYLGSNLSLPTFVILGKSQPFKSPASSSVKRRSYAYLLKLLARGNKAMQQDSSRHAWHTAGTPQIVQAYPGDTANSFPYHYHKAEYHNDVSHVDFLVSWCIYMLLLNYTVTY